jgi:hypothetical protein
MTMGGRTRMVMARALLALVAAGAGFAAACASSSTVQVPVDDARMSFQEMQKLDCSVYDEKGHSLTVGLNFSLLWGAAASGPFVERGSTTGVKWDKSVQFIIAQYKELCGRFNAGALTQAAYNARLAEIDQLYAEALGIRQNADEVIRRHSQQAFSELDKQAGEAAAQPAASTGDADNVVAAVDRLVSQLGVQ